MCWSLTSSSPKATANVAVDVLCTHVEMGPIQISGLYHDRFERLLDDLERVHRGAGDQRPQHDRVDDDHHSPADHAAGRILLAVLAVVQRDVLVGGCGGHWTNCSWPITATLLSPLRLVDDSTSANTA